MFQPKLNREIKKVIARDKILLCFFFHFFLTIFIRNCLDLKYTSDSSFCYKISFFRDCLFVMMSYNSKMKIFVLDLLLINDRSSLDIFFRINDGCWKQSNNPSSSSEDDNAYLYQLFMSTMRTIDEKKSY